MAKKSMIERGKEAREANREVCREAGGAEGAV